MVDQVILRQRKRIGRHPIYEQAGGETGDKESKHYRQKAHRHPLVRIDVPGRYLPGPDKYGRRQDRQDKVRVRLC